MAGKLNLDLDAKLETSALAGGTHTHPSGLHFREDRLVKAAKYDHLSPKQSCSSKLPSLRVDVCHISSLPCEILLNIFSYFRLDELFSYIAPVCVQWRQLAQDPTLRKMVRFSLDQKKISTYRRLELLKELPNLVSLEVQSCMNVVDLLWEAANKCPRLRHITADVPGYRCVGRDVIQALTNNCPEVRTIHLRGLSIQDGDYLEIAKFKNLRHLNISQSLFLDDRGLIAIAKNCHHLEYLDLEAANSFHDYAVVFLTQNLGNSLKCLFLDGGNLTDVSYSSLAACKGLQELGISVCRQMTGIGLTGIMGLSKLRCLKLQKGIQLFPEGLTKMFSSGNMSNLTYLNLADCCMVNDKVLFSIARACPLLTNVVLIFCMDVTDAGISALVSSCPHLKVLDLMGLSELTGSSFVDVAKQLPHLEILNLKCSGQVDEAILQQLVIDHPYLHIFNYMGFDLRLKKPHI